jgi:hypothetical protein
MPPTAIAWRHSVGSMTPSTVGGWLIRGTAKEGTRAVDDASPAKGVMMAPKMVSVRH